MKLTEISIENFLGIEKFNTTLQHPVCIISGPNASGKSSIQNAIRMILTGEPSRIHLKKNYGELVRDAEGVAQAMISVTTNEATETAIIKQSGRGDGLPNPNNVPYALRATLDMHLFPNLDQKERRAFLFNLCGVSISFDQIKERLLEKNFRESHIDELKPVLRSGFPAACIEARERTSGARGVWKSVTGETYGSEKGETWQMALPEAFNEERYEAVKAEIDAANNTIRENQAKLDANELNIKKSAEFEKRKNSLVADAQKLEKANTILDKINPDYCAVKDELGKLEQELLECKGEKKVDPLACPECGAALELQDADETSCAKLISYKPQEGNPERATELEPLINEYHKSLAEMEETINAETSNQRTATEARSALNMLLDLNIDLLSQREGDDYRSQIATAQSSLNSLAYEKERIDGVREKLANAEVKNAQAWEAHEEVKAWEALEDILSPNGLPAELLGTALKPFNDELNNNSVNSNWGLVQITADMDITYNGRLYYLLSESEKWRVDAMLAETISFLSGHQLLMFDQADILSLPERNNLLNWCDNLPENLQILLFATLKAKPEFEGMQSIWLENGLIVD